MGLPLTGDGLDPESLPGLLSRKICGGSGRTEYTNKYRDDNYFYKSVKYLESISLISYLQKLKNKLGDTLLIVVQILYIKLHSDWISAAACYSRFPVGLPPVCGE